MHDRLCRIPEGEDEVTAHVKEIAILRPKIQLQHKGVCPRWRIKTYATLLVVPCGASSHTYTTSVSGGLGDGVAVWGGSRGCDCHRLRTVSGHQHTCAQFVSVERAM